MKKSEIRVGECYIARVSGNIITVKVDEIQSVYQDYPKRDYTSYSVTNLDTGRKLTFRSAAKFRDRAVDPRKAKEITEKNRKAQLEGRAKDGILTRSEAKELEKAKEAPSTIPFPPSEPTSQVVQPAPVQSAEPTAAPSTSCTEDEKRPDPTMDGSNKHGPITSSEVVQGHTKPSSTPLADLLQQSIDILTLPTPQLLQLRTETLDPEVKRVAHDELKRRGYAVSA